MARKKTGTGEFLTAMVQFRLPKDIVRKVDAIAKPRLISRSDIVREAVLFFLKNAPKEI